VAQDVVSVFGRVELGPKAVVYGDVVAVGGRLRRDATASVRGAVTEIALGDAGSHVAFSPWLDGWGPVSFGGFGSGAGGIVSLLRIFPPSFFDSSVLDLPKSRAYTVRQQRTSGVGGEPTKAVTGVGICAFGILALSSAEPLPGG
jgi:hypothetical protein